MVKCDLLFGVNDENELALNFELYMHSQKIMMQMFVNEHNDKISS